MSKKNKFFLSEFKGYLMIGILYMLLFVIGLFLVVVILKFIVLVVGIISLDVYKNVFGFYYIFYLME